METSYIYNDRPKSYTGDVTICGAKVIPIGGHYKESKWQPDKDRYEDVKVFFGIVKDNQVLPVRIELNRWFGKIIVRLINNYNDAVSPVEVYDYKNNKLKGYICDLPMYDKNSEIVRGINKNIPQTPNPWFK